MKIFILRSSKSEGGNNISKVILTLFLASNFLFPISLLAQDGQGLSDTEVIEQIDPEIQKLKDEIQSNQAKLDELDKQKAAYENSVKAKRQEINNLNNQIAILGDTSTKLELQIKLTELEIQKTDLETQNLNLQIERQLALINDQQAKLSGILRTIDAYDRKKSYLEVLILQGTLSGFFKEASEVKAVQVGLKTELDNSVSLKTDLDAKKALLESRKLQLASLKDRLSGDTERLDNEKSAKSFLLDRTKGQESSFQKLLSEVKAEQAQINSDIQNLEVQARKKLAGSSGQLVNDDGFIWPVASRKVTAYFHDPDYPFRYIFEHPAIDIGSTPQGTPIRAARSGYVAKVKFDGSKNYAYILLVHTGGLSTVYGHISKPLVQEDDYVVQGEVIALSGGMPRSAGSGNLTTAAHLHFEVRMNGIPVDPLSYLP